MADDDNNAEGQASGGGKKKIIILGVLAILLIGASVGGTIVALKMFAPEPEAPVEETTEEPVVETKKSAIYYPIKPAIIVNFDHKGRQRYAQVEVTLLIRDESVISAVELHSPMINNALILTIGGQSYADIQSAEGKELVRQACLQAVQKILEKEIGTPGVEQVLFTNFVMQ